MNASDNDLLLITVIGILAMTLIAVFFVLFVIQYRRRQLEFEAEKLSLEREYNEELLRTQLELSERMMQSVSEEIHDNIGQSLTVAKMQMHDLAPENFMQRAQTAGELISRALTDLRNISRALNGEFILKEGIVASLKNEVKLIHSAGKVKCRFSGDLPYPCLDPHSEIILFRCVQETLSNALKHSGADQIDVEMSGSENGLEIKITDNGVGLPPKEVLRTGLGMENIKKRIALLKGEVKFHSAPEKGTTVHFKLPC